MSLVGSVGIVGMDDLFSSVGLVHLFGLVNLFSSGCLGLRAAELVVRLYVMSCCECMLAFYFQTWEQDVSSSMVTFTCVVANSNCFC